MKNIISKKVQDMQPSGIRAFFDLVLGMKEVISLGVGEPDFVTPWQIREAGIYSLEEGFTSYTSNKGLYKLRLSISRDLKNRRRKRKPSKFPRPDKKCPKQKNAKNKK